MGLGEEGPDLGRLGWGSGLHFPSSQVFEDLLDDLFILDESQYTHPTLAFGTAKGVNLPGSSPGQAPIF